MTPEVPVYVKLMGVSEFKSAVEDARSSFTGAAKSMIAGFIGFEAVKKTIDGLVESFKSFDEEAVMSERLRASFKGEAESLIQLAKAQQENTRYAKDEYEAAANTLSMHKMNASQIKQLLPVIADYAAKSGHGLVETANAFSYAIQFGSTRALRQFGIEVDKTGSQQEIFNALLRAGEGDVKGMAERMGKLGAGPVIELKNQFKEFQEVIGEWLTPAVQTYSKALSGLLKQYTEMLAGRELPDYEKERAAYLKEDEKTLLRLQAIQKQGAFSYVDAEELKRLGVADGNLQNITKRIEVLQKLISFEKPKEQKSGLSTLGQDAIKAAEEAAKVRSEQEEFLAKDEIERMKYQGKAKQDEIDKYNQALEEKRKGQYERQKREDHRQAEDEDKARGVLAKYEEKDLDKKGKSRLHYLKMQQVQELALFKKGSAEYLFVMQKQAQETEALAWEETKEKIQASMSSASGVLGALDKIGQASKANAQVMKRIKEGEALVSGASAAIKALDNPIPVLKWIDFAAVVATTAAEVAIIEKQGFAKGTNYAPGGLSLVGEEGPELVNLPRGSQVFTNSDTRNILNSTMGDTHMHVYGPTFHVNGDVSQKTITAMSQATQRAIDKGVKQALRNMQSAGKLSGVTVYN